MSLCTFTLYELYWAYRNWQRIRDRTGESISPFWRAFFAPLWAFSLFKRIKDDAPSYGVAVPWSSGFFGILYLILTVSWRLPDPWWLISLLSFVPLVAVVQTVTEMHEATAAAESLNSGYSGANVAILILGGLFTLMAIIGTILPA